MKPLLTLLLTLLICTNLFATAQEPDKIIYKGKLYMLFSNPLEKYFEKYPDKRPKSKSMSTALWRGYIATFEVKEMQLFLKDIEIEYLDTTSKGRTEYKLQSVLNEVFPNQKEVKIDWLTGLLVIPRGKMKNYVHMGYGSTFKKYTLLEISKGDLKKEKRLSYKQYEKFKEKQFQAFRQTDEYLKIKNDLQKNGTPDKFIDSFLRSYIVGYTSKILTE